MCVYMYVHAYVRVHMDECVCMCMRTWCVCMEVCVRDGVKYYGTCTLSTYMPVLNYLL